MNNLKMVPALLVLICSSFAMSDSSDQDLINQFLGKRFQHVNDLKFGATAITWASQKIVNVAKLSFHYHKITFNDGLVAYSCDVSISPPNSDGKKQITTQLCYVSTLDDYGSIGVDIL